MIPKQTSGTDGSSPSSSTRPVLITESAVPEDKPATSKTNTWQECKPPGSGHRAEFKPLPFLYRMLLGIFVVEAAFLAFSFKACTDLTTKSPGTTVQEMCPRLGERAENLFGVSIATVLSLMTGQAVENFRKKD